MGMFSKNNFYAESASFIKDEDIIAQECYEDNSHVAALRVVAESEANWNQIMKAMAIQELASYEETGDADYYVTEAGTGFLQSVKDFFKKLLEKIKGIFAKFISVIDSWTKDDKAFVSKYKDKILKANTHDFEFEGYNFTIKEYSVTRDDAKAANAFTDAWDSKTKDEWDDLTKEYRGDKLEDLLDNYRANFIKNITSSGYSSNTCDSGEFSSDLFEALRNGESSKETLEINDLSPVECINIITNTADMKKKAKKAFDALQKGINDAIKDVDKAEKEVRRDIPGKKDDTDPKDVKASYVAFCGAYTGYLRSKEALNTTAYGAYLQAIKDQNRQAKAYCVKLMSYKPKNESTSYYEEGTSILGNIKMI